MWTRAELRAEGAGHRLGGAARMPRSSAARRSFRPITRRDPEAGRSGRVASRCDAWKDWLAFHTLNQQANVLPKPIRDASFAFNGTALTGHAAAAAARPAGAERRRQCPRGCGRQGLCRQIFPGLGQGRGPEDGREHQGRLRPRVEALDWMAPSTKEEALKKVEIDRRRRRLSRHVARLFGARDRADDAYANQKDAGAGRISPPDRQDRQADGPQRMVDAAAAGQRGQPAGAERAQLPGGDPRSGRSSTPRPTRRSTMARSARSSGTRSATASTITAPCSIRPAACATGGRRPTSQRFQAAGNALAAQYDAYEALPGLHVNGKLTLGENIADVAGLAAAYDAYRASLGGKEAPVIDGFTGDQRFFLALRRPGRPRCARRRCAQRVADRRPLAGSVPRAHRAATSTPGTRRSTSSRGRSSISRPKSA